MNAGLWAKALRETWRGTVLFAAGAFVFQLILAVLLPALFEDLTGQLARIPFIQNVIRAFLGPIGDQIGPSALMAFPWVHPVVLALLWTHAISFATRVPVAEIERGTVDFLLGLPVSRWQAYATEGALLLASGVVIVTTGLVGNLTGSLLSASEHVPEAWKLIAIMVNQLGLYLAVGGLACLVSAVGERRGRAIGAVFGVVLTSFFVGVVCQLWEPATAFAWIGLMHYFQPHRVLVAGTWPVGDTLILLGSGVVLWVAGGTVFARRDICTV